MSNRQSVEAGKAFVELFVNDNKLVRGLRNAARKVSHSTK